jgi:DNA-binding response OmpR family regulator
MTRNSRRLLIVDEEPARLDSLTDSLNAEGYFVLPAANSREMLALASKLPVDLALLDLDVLAKDSRKTFRRFTRDHPRVPVIFTSARSHRLPANLGNGATVLLEKPIQLPKLRRAVSRLWAHRCGRCRRR